jgi:hypothetical protein
VTFDIPKGAVKVMNEEGNLDIGNFAAGDGDYQPERVFSESELGVIRTYPRPTSG